MCARNTQSLEKQATVGKRNDDPSDAQRQKSPRGSSLLGFLRSVYYVTF
jgi:hypothetical protein